MTEETTAQTLGQLLQSLFSGAGEIITEMFWNTKLTDRMLSNKVKRIMAREERKRRLCMVLLLLMWVEFIADSIDRQDDFGITGYFLDFLAVVF